MTFVDPSTDDVFDLHEEEGGSITLCYAIRHGRHPVMEVFDTWALQCKLRSCIRLPNPEENIKRNRLLAEYQAEQERAAQAHKEAVARQKREWQLENCRNLLLNRGHSAQDLETYSDDLIIAMGDLLHKEARQRAEQEMRRKAEAEYQAREAEREHEREHEREVDRMWDAGYVYTAKGTWAPRKMNDMRGVWGVYPAR